jgi:hypothetical protein
MQHNPGKLGAMEQDPDGLLRLLDLELLQKRALWQRNAERHRTSRMVWGFSVFVVLAAAFVVLFILFSKASEERVNARGATVSDSIDR